ncbi:MAG: tRNA (adenosine(37)-N6)-threonylcarbamoyltransferase complex dimerization subunit type 1 TsaB [Longimonas sp.]|uniref:tRNA (adenosine(37)-N6)-threonylcarbamoyltransferase complex dimerization subunit type 1 TsaB n=1 Tax=Longimonas sp. TaxID=2039626 RepID=UPI00335C381E
MNTLLALETADTTCGVAVWHDGECQAEAHIHRPRVHAARLTPLIEETLDHADVAASQVEAVAVSAGPGSYTGLRIGMSSAKGFAMAVGCPLVTVPTLEAAAHALAPWASPGDMVVAALDARRNDVFAAAYIATDVAGGSITPIPTHEAWTEAVEAGPYGVDDLADAVEQQLHGSITLWYTGPGAAKAAAPLQMRTEETRAHEARGRGMEEHAMPNNKNDKTGQSRRVRVAPSEHRRLSAREVARRGIARAQQGALQDPCDVEPAYLKAFHGTPPAKSV